MVKYVPSNIPVFSFNRKLRLTIDLPLIYFIRVSSLQPKITTDESMTSDQQRKNTEIVTRCPIGFITA